jgi:hypothetical protein
MRKIGRVSKWSRDLVCINVTCIEWVVGAKVEEGLVRKP